MEDKEQRRRGRQGDGNTGKQNRQKRGRTKGRGDKKEESEGEYTGRRKHMEAERI